MSIHVWTFFFPKVWLNGYEKVVFPIPSPLNIFNSDFRPPLVKPASQEMFEICVSVKADHIYHQIGLLVRVIDHCCLQLLGYFTGYKSYEFWNWGGRDRPKGRSRARDHLIEGSSFLGFAGDYNSLEKVCGLKREDIPLCYNKLFDAVYYLSLDKDEAVAPKNKKKAFHLIVLKQMIIEAIKFESIAKFVITNYNSVAGGVTPDRDMLDSEAHHENHIKKHHIENQPAPPPAPRPRPRPRPDPPSSGWRPIKFTTPDTNDIMWTAPETVWHLETELVQVFCVSIDMAEAEGAKIYGTILETMSPVCPDIIYKREKEDAEPIGPGKVSCLSLIGTKCMVANDRFRLTAKLSSDMKGGIINDSFCWSTFHTHNVYDSVLKYVFAGSDGATATMFYAVISNGVRAFVEVKLLEGASKAPAKVKVRGRITASITKFPDHKILLMCKEGLNEYAEVSPGEDILLSTRPSVAVPLDSELEVDARLYDFDSKDVIAAGSAKLSAKPGGTSATNISGQIQVKVHWHRFTK